MLGTLALPVLAAAPAGAAPAALPSITTGCEDLPPLPYWVHTKAVTIRSKPTTRSTALGVLYNTHRFTVSRTSGGWVYITDRTTGVRGWVSGTYVYRDIRMCLD
ncbi:SH3 domain-containing protein [Streptomyces acidiscabies]|uniref:SH3 domain-containing protein n=1 Tax=Streptomyces acidiscabies TaxID=42234 RepID=A0AAP6BJ29_9ACTN|nr:SH3 domain-containing protein [Streptomyces acidiscabies]MBP5935403.1 SH3 domain-containing protein [Streptomyces sp. LBUM 1476]MBZ3916744.1 SH3 domain-containing protein [Streptomyces acidiscabies]MDX2965618.1 SH3 domain-containing protein [Streptomyces acidiscabies]MDX3024880.1 SH3 domain-containing protein [Streptomyces acidiscabies]MDX3795534.1 SH3 domain-containing protein [Streptomyces acidiscabies]